MPGTTNIGIGLFCFVIGAGLSIWAYSSVAEEGGTYVIFSGLMGVGAIQFIVGLFQYCAYSFKDDAGKAEVHAETSGEVLIQVMLRVAAIDGKIDDKEIDTILDICTSILKMETSKKEIKKEAEKMINDGFDLYEYIEEKRFLINEKAIPLIFKASYLVALADGRVDDDEAEMIKKIAKSLGISSVDMINFIKELGLN